jgi:hypothetical protein
LCLLGRYSTLELYASPSLDACSIPNTLYSCHSPQSTFIILQL